MLSPSDAAVVARDPALPGLPVLLDGAQVTALLRAPVRRDYLRYKPGTSCVLGGRVELPSGPAGVFVTVYAADGLGKIDKTVAEAPHGAVLHVDRARGLVAALATADRDLPFLAALSREKSRRRALAALLPDRPELETAPLQTLSYKPMRRWVGLLTPYDGPPVVLRSYRVEDAPRAADVVRELASGAPRTPRLLGLDPTLGSLAVEYVEGEPLDLLLAQGDVTAGQLAEVGQALAHLHARRLDGLPARAGTDDATAVRAAAAQVAVLLPELAAQAQGLADDLCRRWPRLRVDPTTVHGDFSADQVVLGPDGVGLVDLDEAAAGEPAADLACAVGALHAAAVLGRGPRDVERWTAALHGGYAERADLPTAARLELHLSAALLRRAVEPFRDCRPDWPAECAELLERAELACPVPALA